VPQDLRSRSRRYFYPDQYNNPANWKAHFEGTGAEIIEQTGGASRISSTSWAPAERSWELAAAEARHAGREVHFRAAVLGFHGLEGLKHMPTAIVPGIYDPSLADDNLWIETEDAYAMTRWLGANEGLLVGMSSGANVVRRAGREKAGEAGEGRDRDGAVRRRDQYLSEPFWND
jgi:S-sulfo-L-cysteine synthase (O-acetyl-L-serine-dependent)